MVLWQVTAGVAGVIASVALVWLGFYLKEIGEYRKIIENTVVNEVDISSLADGVYLGDYDARIVSVRAEVHIVGGKLHHIILLEHKNGRGAAAEAVVPRMVEAQKIKVDTVSGATNSSLVIQKAVENALG